MDENVSVYFTVTREYQWDGSLSELPALTRKGVRHVHGELDTDALRDKIDDAILARLEKSRSTTLQDEQFKILEVTEP